MTGNCSTGFSRITEATYEVVVQVRGTGEEVCSFDEGEGNFGRALDQVSTAEWEFPIEDGCGCDCPVIERQHELAFYRDDWPEPAWIGPILRTVPGSGNSSLRINAVDRLYWSEGAPSSRDIVYQAPNEIEIVDLMEELFAEADRYEVTDLYREFRGGLPPAAGLLVESKLRQGESVWSQIVSKAKSVVDFTVVGPHLYWGSPEIPIEDGPTITSAHFDVPPIVDRDAGSVVTQVVVTAAGGVVGIYPPLGEETDLGLGKRTEFISDTNLNTEAEATARAFEIFEANKAPSVFVITGEGTLSPDFPLPLHELIPGRNFLVTADGPCLEPSDELLQLFNLVVEIRTEAGPVKQLREYRVAGDFGDTGSQGKSERQSG